ncbi:MAG TPA: NADH:ubiquinone oxidoreductase [Thermoprotei archaeon]|nr:NADH:ubiquinone oxidoreductase [Thermoprotei archaeon]
MNKIRLGIFSLSSCEGCLVQILNLEDYLVELFNMVDLVSFKLIGVDKEFDTLDVAVIEGAVMNDEEEKELKDLRERSKIIVALGDCACYGGKFIIKDFHVNGIKMNLPRKTTAFKADPLDKYVKVDYYVYGCPIVKYDFLQLMKDLLMDKPYRPKTYNVCAECILKENNCLIEAGLPCLGPITRAGCNALCPSVGRECIGCRGLSDDANIESLIQIFRERNIEVPSYLPKLLKGEEKWRRK